MHIKTTILVGLLILVASSGILIRNGLTEPHPTQLGTGVLWAYTESDRTNEAPKNDKENYQVLPSETYYFNLTGITEFYETNIIILANTTFDGDIYTVKTADRYVGSPPSNVTFDWRIPGLPLMTSINIMYGPKADLNLDGHVSIIDVSIVSYHWYPGPPLGGGGYDPNFDVNNDGRIDIQDAAIVSVHWYSGPPLGMKAHSWCYAKNALSPNPRILLVVPEVFLGPISALVALFSGVGIRKYIQRKKD